MFQVVFQSNALCFSAGRFALVALLLVTLPALAQTQPSADMNAASQIDAQAALDHSAGGLTFIENRGQWDAEARYLVKVGGLNAWVTDSGLVFDFYERAVPEAEESDARSLMMAEVDDARLTSAGSHRGHVVRMQFEGATAGEVAGTHRREGYHNYFLGNDPSRWASYVPLYGEVMVSELYDGVGMRLYDDGGFLRYDLLTSPGADLSEVRLRFEGADAVWVTPEGDLAMETSLGEVRQAGLLAYQEIDGRQVAVPAVFTVLNDGAVGFDVEPLDPSLPLVIDPVIYSTFLGGAELDVALDIAVAASGSAFVTGFTNRAGSWEANFPTTAGAYQATHPGGIRSGFVSKLNADGTGLVYSTFLGGSNDDYAYAIALDASGNAFVAGVTYSANFPTTGGAYQTIRPGLHSAFVTKLNASGTGLVYSTFLGGAQGEGTNDIAVDSSGNAFMVGTTSSADFPTTDGAYQPTDPGGFYSAFVTKLNESGTGLVYSTFLGSASDDLGYAIALDAIGNAFVTGETRSIDFPITDGAYQTTHPGGDKSVFITKLNASGSDLVYSTFLGGTDYDLTPSIAVDSSGNAFVSGETSSTDFPTTESAYQTTNPGGRSAFVTKLSASGASLVYSTYLGGTGYDRATGITIDAYCNAFVTGRTDSMNFETTEDAFQTTNPGQTSAYITKLDASGAVIEYSTFLGGAMADVAWAIAVDASSNAFVAGWTHSLNFPTTAGAVQTIHPGYWSTFVTKLEIPGPVSTEPDGNLQAGFALQGAYPNPFTSQTTLVFAVTHPETVLIEAFDLLGRRMATIVEEHFEAGTHERVFDASGLSTGVYIVRMTSGEFSQSRRVVVVR